MATDRTLFKNQSVGALNSIASSVANAKAAVSDEATRAYCWTKSGNENSSNNVVETAMFVVNRAGLVKSAKLITNTAVAANATNGFVVTVTKRPVANAASSVTVATWNVDPAAQGAITSFAAAALSVVTSSDASVAAGDVLTFKCTKFGTGALLDSPSAVVVDVEED